MLITTFELNKAKNIQITSLRISSWYSFRFVNFIFWYWKFESDYYMHLWFCCCFWFHGVLLWLVNLFYLVLY